MKRTSGLSLLEIVVALLLFVMVGSLAIILFQRTSRVSARGTIRASLHTTASLAVEKLAIELQRTRAEALTILTANDLTSPSAIGFTKIKNIADTGSVVWEQEAHVFLWLPSEKTLRHSVWTSPSALGGEYPVPLGAEALPTIPESSDSRTKPLASNVSLFRPVLEGRMVDVTLELRQISHSKKEEKYLLERSVYLRNG